MSGIIPKEQLAGFQRWQINSFDHKPAPPPAASPAPGMPETLVVPEAPASTTQLPTTEEIEQLRAEARKTAYDEGFQEGMAAAAKAGEIAAQEAMAHISTLIGHVETALSELDQSVARQVLDLALVVAAQVTRGTIQTKDDYLLPIIKEAITSLPLHHAHITLHLNPADAALVRVSQGEQFSQSNIQILDNPDIKRGGCRLTAGSSEIDASIETRWSRVLEAIGAEPQAWLIQT